jgi:hypothetical protein
MKKNEILPLNISLIRNMNALTKGIEYAIQTAIEEFSQLILQKYDSIDPSELENLWNDVSSEMKISVTVKNVPTKPVSKPTQKPNIVSSDKPKCSYILTKGQRSGESCGNNSMNGMSMCSRHKQWDNKEQKPKKVLPNAKKSVVPKNPVKKSPVSSDLNRVLRQNSEHGVIWNVNTGLVFKSKTDCTVYGRIVDNKIVDLDQEAINLCKQYGYAFENSEGVEDVEDVEGDDVEDITDTPQSKSSVSKKYHNPPQHKESIINAIKKINAEEVEDVLKDMQRGDDSDNESVGDSDNESVGDSDNDSTGE